MLLLNGFTVFHYLIGKGFLSPHELIDDSVAVRISAKRNTAFAVRRRAGKSLFIKQAATHGRDRVSTIEREATFYWLVSHDKRFSAVLPLLPTFFEYDYHNSVLVLEYLEDFQDLSSRFLERRSLPPDLGRDQATVLATVHRNTCLTDPSVRHLFPNVAPAPFHLFGENVEKVFSESTLGSAVLKLVKDEPTIQNTVRSLCSDWSPSTLIHGDVKPSNILTAQTTPLGHPILRIVDWELADFGNPLWDVAGLIHSYLLLWLLPQVFSARQHASVGRPAAGLDPREVRSWATTFWHTYVEHMGFEESTRRDALRTVAQFCALKLLHTCYSGTWAESDHHAATEELFRLSRSMLSAPDDSVHLLVQP